MKKALLFVAIVFGVALLGGAQIAPDVAKIRATTFAQDGNGRVQPTRPHQIAVRGNVQIAAAGPIQIEKR